MSASSPTDATIDLDARVVFFPVRHHSPLCARMVVELAERLRPEAILIEGPSDYNDRIDELFLGHHLPIAIYSYVRLADGSRRGAYYPFCVFSPEWQALQAGRNLGAAIRFIDLPWAEVADDDALSHRYADAEMRGGEYISTLCRRLGVEDFDALWDEMFEVEPEHLVHHLVGSALKDTPDDLKKLRHYFNHVVKGRAGAAWKAYYEARSHLL